MILSEMNAKKRWICAASPGRVVAQCQFENGGYLKDAIKCKYPLKLGKYQKLKFSIFIKSSRNLSRWFSDTLYRQNMARRHYWSEQHRFWWWSALYLTLSHCHSGWEQGRTICWVPQRQNCTACWGQGWHGPEWHLRPHLWTPHSKDLEQTLLQVHSCVKKQY